MGKVIGSSDLETRLKLRAYGKGKPSVYYLDLRGKKWGDLGRLVLRQPGSPEWPNGGPTTSDLETAKEWAGDEEYVALVTRRRDIAEKGQGILTVREALEEYLDELRKSKSPQHSTYRNRASSLRKHLEPLYDRILGSLNQDLVQSWIDDVRVEKAGKKVKPARNTRAALMRGLYAIWQHHMRPQDPPFRDIELGEQDRSQAIREAIKDGQDIWQFLLGGAYEPGELTRLIVGARWYYDYVIRPSPPLRAVTMDTYAEAIVLMAATSARLSEACRLQWHHFREADGVLSIPGTKSMAAVRIQPVQDSMLPWLAHLRTRFVETYGREPAKNDYLIQTDPRQPRKRPASRGLGDRIATIQEVCGLKRPQRASHILRATYISTAHAKGIDRERYKRYVGHASAEKKGRREVTDDYITDLLDLIQPGDRRIMDFIPTPEEVAERVNAFEPTAHPSRGAGAQ